MKFEPLNLGMKKTAPTLGTPPFMDASAIGLLQLTSSYSASTTSSSVPEDDPADGLGAPCEWES